MLESKADLVDLEKLCGIIEQKVDNRLIDELVKNSARDHS
jgi:hypothetical protein